MDIRLNLVVVHSAHQIDSIMAVTMRHDRKANGRAFRRFEISEDSVNGGTKIPGTVSDTACS